MSIHVERAKRWDTNPWLAEWMYETVKHCRGEGKPAFEAWVLMSKGREDGRKKIAHCSDPPKPLPVKKYPGKGLNNALMWNRASVEFGVSDETLKLYHEYVTLHDCCPPERTRPAPKRRRGESSGEWLARRLEALHHGCKYPNIDWEAARAIAVSEYDRVQDVATAWRKDSARTFFYSVLRRSDSIIPSPEILKLDRDYFQEHVTSDAFRSQISILHMSHWCWSFAAQLFEDLARKGLCTASAIEREYRRDEDLMWRLFACGARATELTGILWGLVRQTVSYCEHYRPYFKRWRGHDGLAHIDKDTVYLGKHSLKTELDCFIIEVISSTGMGASAFYHGYCKLLADSPSEASKFSEEAFQALGDFAVAMDFHANVAMSPFGITLRKYALEKSAGKMPPLMVRHIMPMDFSRVPHDSTMPGNDKLFSQGTTLTNYVSTNWTTLVGETDMGFICGAIREAVAQDLQNSDPIRYTQIMITMFDQFWINVDRFFFENAVSLDSPNEPGRVAKEFGLFDPNDPSRPANWLALLELQKELIYQAAKTPAPAASTKEHVSSFPVASATDSAAQSAHSYLNEAQAAKPKSKTKTKGNAAPVDAAPQSDGPQSDDPGVALDDFPDTLPTTFDLPRKVLKIFQRLLEPDVLGSSSEDANQPKRGQIRWGDFEKAMKRVGFDVIQTAGSSVRFDPPAKTARPISFHRPHPDSTMGPDILKFVGARLRRCYGWTATNFVSLANDVD